jgi:hypothetical protein
VSQVKVWAGGVNTKLDNNLPNILAFCFFKKFFFEFAVRVNKGGHPTTEQVIYFLFKIHISAFYHKSSF